MRPRLRHVAQRAPAGTETVNGVKVRRFPVQRERDPYDFGRRSHRVFEHRIRSPTNWPGSKAKGRRAGRSSTTSSAAPTFDFVLLFSYRYYHAFHGARRRRREAVLVPTAERDPAIGLGIFAPIFRGVRAVMYNSHEERAMIHAATANEEVPGVVVGVGSEVPAHTEPARFRRRFTESAAFCHLHRPHR